MGFLSSLLTQRSAFFECHFYWENIFVHENIFRILLFKNRQVVMIIFIIIILVKGSVIETGGFFSFNRAIVVQTAVSGRVRLCRKSKGMRSHSFVLPDRLLRFFARRGTIADPIADGLNHTEARLVFTGLLDHSVGPVTVQNTSTIGSGHLGARLIDIMDIPDRLSFSLCFFFLDWILKLG